MGKINYQLLLQKQKRGLRAYTILCAVFLIIVGTYSYFKFMDYSLYREAVEINETSLATLKQVTSAEKAAYLSGKSDFDDMSDEIESSLKEVFPLADNYTELTRAFDAFEQQIHRSKSPFVISNIEYQEVRESEDGNYRYLPLRMTISSSEDNFTKFMHYVEQSGSLLDKIRLMDIQSIHLSFGEQESGLSNSINFSIKIHAYFQNI
jgi:hypothetical protein